MAVRLRAAVDRTLDHIRGLYPAATFSVMSSLAEGADRLIARAAMNRLGARLYVPLPLPFEVYVQDFGDSSTLDHEASIAEFDELLGRADRYFELPLEFGTRVELAEATEAGADRACAAVRARWRVRSAALSRTHRCLGWRCTRR